MNGPESTGASTAPIAAWRRWFNRRTAMRAGVGAVLFFLLKGLAWIALAVWALR